MACVGRKTEIDLGTAQSAIEHLIGTGIALIEPVSGGEQSQAFKVVSSDGASLLARFRDSELPFQKDRLAFELFSSHGIPIPRIHAINKARDSIWVCVSDHCEGRGIDVLRQAEYEQLLKDLFEVHILLQSADTGSLKEELQSLDPDFNFPSWKDELSKIPSKEKHDWDLLIEKKYISSDQFQAFSGALLQLLDELGDHRYCVHGDFGFNNVLAQDGKVTAVLDWEALTVGDFVYDLAWLDFWPAPITHKDSFYLQYQQRGVDLRDFDERFRAYTLAFGLDSLAVHGKYDDVDGCKWILDRLLSVLG